MHTLLEKIIVLLEISICLSMKNYFENLNAMKIKDEDKHEPQYLSDGSYQESVVLVVKGLKIKLKRILTIFTTIDLSSNKFEGEIPEVLG